MKLLEMLKNKEFKRYIKDLYGITKLIKFGSGYVIVLPKTWVEFSTYGEDKTDSYWVKLISNEDSSFRIELIEQDELDQISIAYIEGTRKKAREVNE